MATKSSKPKTSHLEKLSKKKRFLFKIGAVLVVIILIASVEILLRVVGYGSSFPLFITSEKNKDQLVMNPHVGEKYFFFTDNATSGYQEPFDKHKKPGTYRVFVLGASTGVGYPYRHNGSFHRWLQFGLDETFPDKTIEIINLSLTAINSYTLRDFVPQVIDQQPDAVLIYAGHNEYYGALGVGASNALSDSPWFVNSAVYLRKFRIVQGIAQGISSLKKAISTPPEKRESLMEKMVADQYIPLDSDKYKAGIKQFDQNMSTVLELLDHNQIPTFISTLVSNESGLKPFVSDTTSQEKNADYHYNLAEKALKNTDFKIAKEEFMEAKERDELRFRAPNAINTLIREKAAVLKNIHLVETYKNFENASPHGILGNEFILEHVHPNLDGYALMGYSFYNALKNRGEIEQKWPRPLSFHQLRTQMPITIVDSLAGFYEILTLKEGWPFFEPIDKSKLKTSTTPQIIAGKLAIKQYSWESAMQQLYTYYVNNGQDLKALQVLRGLILDKPQQENVYLEVGNLALKIDSIPLAERFYERLSLINPSSVNTKIIARSLINAGALKQALPYVKKIKAENPGDMQAVRYLNAINEILKIQAEKSVENVKNRLKLAKFYLNLDQSENSKTELQEVLDQEPSNPEALQLMEQLKIK